MRDRAASTESASGALLLVPVEDCRRLGQASHLLLPSGHYLWVMECRSPVLAPLPRKGRHQSTTTTIPSHPIRAHLLPSHPYRRSLPSALRSSPWQYGAGACRFAAFPLPPAHYWPALPNRQVRQRHAGLVAIPGVLLLVSSAATLQHATTPTSDRVLCSRSSKPCCESTLPDLSGSLPIQLLACPEAFPPLSRVLRVCSPHSIRYVRIPWPCSVEASPNPLSLLLPPSKARASPADQSALTSQLVVHQLPLIHPKKLSFLRPSPCLLPSHPPAEPRPVHHPQLPAMAAPRIST